MERQIIADEHTYVIKSQDSVTVHFPVGLTEEEIAESRFAIQLRGQVGIHPSLMYEGGLPALYRDIDDSLSEETHHSRFSLKISSDNGADGSGGQLLISAKYGGETFLQAGGAYKEEVAKSVSSLYAAFNEQAADKTAAGDRSAEYERANEYMAQKISGLASR